MPRSSPLRPGSTPAGPQDPVTGVGEGIVLCVSRLLPYKHVELVVEAAASLDREVVIVGDGPEADRLRAVAPSNVRFLPRTSDPELRWLYARAAVLAAPAEEDYGLTPVEAAAFGVPTVARAAGGHLVTVVDGTRAGWCPTRRRTTSPPPSVMPSTTRWDQARLRAHANDLSEPAFARRLREVVEEVVR